METILVIENKQYFCFGKSIIKETKEVSQVI